MSEAVTHKFKKFQAVLTLIGDGIKQVIEFEGAKCGESADLTGYIAEIMRPHISGLTPSELKQLREQIVKLEEGNKVLGAELVEAKKNLALAEKDASTAKKAALKSQV